MIPKKLFENVRVPRPAPELREQAIAQARNYFGSKGSTLLIDRLWEDHVVRYAWSTGIVASLLVLIFWNPPLPGMNRVEFTEQISRDDRMEINALGIQPKPAMTIQFRNINTSQILEGEDL